MAAVAPVIDGITEKQYSASDSITCSAEGVPEPRVTWKHISGSMPKTLAGLSGQGQAVLRNLQNGDHVWECTATNSVGSDAVNVTFTGAFCCRLSFNADVVLMKLTYCRYEQ